MISFVRGYFVAHIPHWKSANSSIVTVAVGEPSILGGCAPIALVVRGVFSAVVLFADEFVFVFGFGAVDDL